MSWGGCVCACDCESLDLREGAPERFGAIWLEAFPPLEIVLSNFYGTQPHNPPPTQPPPPQTHASTSARTHPHTHTSALRPSLGGSLYLGEGGPERVGGEQMCVCLRLFGGVCVLEGGAGLCGWGKGLGMGVGGYVSLMWVCLFWWVVALFCITASTGSVIVGFNVDTVQGLSSSGQWNPRSRFSVCCPGEPPPPICRPPPGVNGIWSKVFSRGDP